MRSLGPRTTLKKTYPRCHYNSKGKSKKQFETEKEAQDYIAAHKLSGYTIYLCRVCNKFHISHKNKPKNSKEECEP
jgi:hypothetical protein